MMYDVVAVDLKTHKVRVLDYAKSESDAEAIVNLAVLKRGVDKEIFCAVPHGKYTDGAPYVGTR